MRDERVAERLNRGRDCRLVARPSSPATLLTSGGQGRERTLRRGAGAGRQLRGALGGHVDDVESGGSQFDGLERQL